MDNVQCLMVVIYNEGSCCIVHARSAIIFITTCKLSLRIKNGFRPGGRWLINQMDGVFRTLDMNHHQPLLMMETKLEDNSLHKLEILYHIDHPNLSNLPE